MTFWAGIVYGQILGKAIGLTLGNFLFQLLMKTPPDWDRAFEISYFQALAVFAVYLHTRKELKGGPRR